MEEQPKNEENTEHQDEQLDEPSVNTPFLCMTTRYWWFLILFFQHTLIIFMIGCLGTQRWVRQGNDLTEWEGSLLYVETGPESIKSELYMDLKDSDCETLKHLCNTFDVLQTAAGAYVFFELISIIFTFIWMLRVVFHLYEKRFLPDWVSYLWPSLGFLCHILAIIIWAGVTEASFENDCSNLSDEKICSTNGPALAIITVLFWLFYGSIYIFVFLHRNGIEITEKEEAIDKV